MWARVFVSVSVCGCGCGCEGVRLCGCFWWVVGESVGAAL